MNVVLGFRTNKGITGAPHRIVAYDRRTDELVFELSVPGFLNSLATKIAEVAADDPDGVFCYILGPCQVDAFRILLGLKSDLDQYEYFLEPVQPTESERNVEVSPTANGPVDATSQTGRDETRVQSMAAFERLIARSQSRNRSSRGITKSELTIPTLRILEDYNGQWVKLSVLIERLTTLLKPSGTDAEILSVRNDAYFSQKVRDIVSHRHDDSSFIRQGLAEYDSSLRCLRITDSGCNLIRGLRV